MQRFSTIDEVLARNVALGRGVDADGQKRALTPQEFFVISAELGLNQDNPEYARLFDGLVAWIKWELPSRSAVELGAGPGYLLHRLNQRGVTTIGCDGNIFSRDFFVERHGEHADRYRIDPTFSLDYPSVDLFLAVEVFEHIPDDALEEIMKKVSNALRPRFVLFSSTPYVDPHPGWDMQWGHINLKTPQAWDSWFAGHGYHRTGLQPPVTPWAVLYAETRGLRWISDHAAALHRRIRRRVRALPLKTVRQVLRKLR